MDQWDERVKLVESQLKRTERKKTLLVKWKEKSFGHNCGRNVNFHVTIQLLFIPHSLPHVIKHRKLSFVGLRCWGQTERALLGGWKRTRQTHAKQEDEMPRGQNFNQCLLVLSPQQIRFSPYMVGERDPELTRGSGERALTGRRQTHETTVSCGKKDKTTADTASFKPFSVNG